MRKKVFGIVALVFVCTVFTGCNSVQNYSLRSYQGPLPMNSYKHVYQDAHQLPSSQP